MTQMLKRLHFLCILSITTWTACSEGEYSDTYSNESFSEYAGEYASEYAGEYAGEHNRESVGETDYSTSEQAGELMEDTDMTPQPGSDPDSINCDPIDIATHSDGNIACLTILNTGEWCGLSGDIYDLLKLSGVDTEFSCADLDEDCSYDCSEWVLPEYLQDLDDRRSSIHIERTEPQSPQSELERNGLVCNTSSAIDADQELDQLAICTQSLFTPDILSISSCTGLGVAWVTASTEPTSDLQESFFVHLDILQQPDSSFEYVQISIPIDFEPSQLICAINPDLDWSIITVDSESKRLYELNRSTFIPMNIDETLSTQIANVEPSAFTVHESRLFSWKYLIPHQNDINSPPRKIAAHRFFNSRIHHTDLPTQVIDLQVRCQSCNNSAVRPLYAYLTDDLTVELAQEELRYELFSELAPFQAIHSSDQLLALVPSVAQEEPVTRIYFSLWSNAETLDPLFLEAPLFDFPLFFDATDANFTSVTLQSINNESALLQLTLAEEANGMMVEKSVWAIYHVLSDHLQLLDFNDLLPHIGLDHALVSSKGIPLLHDHWLSWPYLLGDTWQLLTQQLSP